MEWVLTGTDLDSYLDSIVNEEDVEEQLVRESRWKVGYRESQFERRGLRESYRDAIALDGRRLAWDDLGVSDQARETLVRSGVSEAELHRFFAHPDVLVESKGLFQYYRALSGVSENRLRKMGSVRPAVRALTGSRSPPGDEEAMERLCRLFNSLISVWASGITDEDPRRRALVSALLTEGGTIEGSSRNAGGRKAVVNVASVIVEDLADRRLLDSFLVKQTSGEEYDRITAAELGASYSPSELFGAYDVRSVLAENGGVVRFSEPDLTVESPSGVTGYGEIKDRKDVSNQWEGWLPLIRSKLVDFRSRDPEAKRMLLQPVFTERMIEGERGSDAEDVGVRGFIESDLLDVPFNISQLVADEEARAFFCAYVRALLGYREDGVAAPTG